jgi:hypothetical protein
MGVRLGTIDRAVEQSRKTGDVEARLDFVLDVYASEGACPSTGVDEH